MVISEEVVTAGHTGVSLEHGVSVQPADDSWGSGILAGLPGLPSDAEEVSYEVAIDEVGGVGDESRGSAVHVEAFLDGLDDLCGSGDPITGKVLAEGRLVSFNQYEMRPMNP